MERVCQTKASEEMTPLKLTPGELKRLERNMQRKKKKAFCVRCKMNPVYISPKGYASVKCATCLFDDFVALGVLDESDLTKPNDVEGVK